MVKLNTKGLHDLSKKLENIEGKNSVNLSDLLPDEFMRNHTTFTTLQELLDASGVKDDSEIGNAEFSEFVAKNSDFSSWDDMLEGASAQWAIKQLS